MTIGKPFREDYPQTQGFGEHPTWYAKFGLLGHNGIDYACPTGTTIIACDDGTIGTVADDPTGYGHYIKVIHSWGESIYAHLQNHLVTVGFPVKRGQTIGISDNTGNSTGPHLHFGIRINPYNKNDGWSGYKDPQPYFGEPESPSVPPEGNDVNIFSKEDNQAWKIAVGITASKSPDLVSEQEVKSAKGSILTPYDWIRQVLDSMFENTAKEAVANYVKEHPVNTTIPPSTLPETPNTGAEEPSDNTESPNDPMGTLPNQTPVTGADNVSVWVRVFPVISKVLSWIWNILKSERGL